MKQEIKVGGRAVELDLLTAQELRTTVEELISGYLRPTTPRRDEDGALAPAAGDITLSLPPVPRGMEIIYTRVIVEAPGSAFTPAVPYNAAGSYIALMRSDIELLDFVSLVAGAAGGGGIPYRFGPWSNSNGIRVRDGEQLRALIHVPPANAGLMLRGEGFLSPIAGGEPGSVVIPGSD